MAPPLFPCDHPQDLSDCDDTPEGCELLEEQEEEHIMAEIPPPTTTTTSSMSAQSSAAQDDSVMDFFLEDEDEVMDGGGGGGGGSGGTRELMRLLWNQADKIMAPPPLVRQETGVWRFSAMRSLLELERD